MVGRSMQLQDLDLRSVIDGMSEGFALLDADFVILDVNAETMRLEPRPRDQIVGRCHWDVYPGSADTDLGLLYKKAMRERVRVSLKHRHVWEDGREIWLDMRAYPVSGGRLAVFFRDVTAANGAERKLRESEERFRGAVGAFVDALWTNDTEGRMTGEQPGWAALTGQTFDEYQGYGWSQAVHPDEAQPTIDAWNAAVAEKRLFEFEHRVRVRSGEWRRFTIRATPVLDEAGAVREWVGVHRDITAATETRRQLARNAETFQKLVRDNPFGVYVVDSRFRLVEVSLGCAKPFAGIEPLLGRDFADIMQIVWEEPFAAIAIGRFRHTLATGESYLSPPKVEIRRNVIAREAYDWRIDRIVLPDGQFGVVCYFYDLSERMGLETELRQALDDKDTLVREIDHRVRNSLSIVSSLLTMQGRAAQSSEVKQALATAAARMQAVARIHERLYKGDQVGIVRFDDYLSQICEDLRNSVGRAGVHLQLDVVPVRLGVDHAVSLGLVITELVTNAFKHCTGDDLTISLKLFAEDGGYALTVEDNGAGMPDDFVAGTGTGLGMRVVNLLTRQVGAKIRFPAPGQPASFKLSIPAEVFLPNGASSLVADADA